MVLGMFPDVKFYYHVDKSYIRLLPWVS